MLNPVDYLYLKNSYFENNIIKISLNIHCCIVNRTVNDISLSVSFSDVSIGTKVCY